MKKLTTYLLSTSLIAAAALSMSVAAYATEPEESAAGDAESTTPTYVTLSSPIEIDKKTKEKSDKFESISEAVQAMIKAKPTGDMTMTLASGTDHSFGDKDVIPNSLTSLTITSDSEIAVEVGSKFTSNTKLTLENIKLTGSNTTFTAKGDLTVKASTLEGLKTIKGSKGTLTFDSDVTCAYPINGFDKVTINSSKTVNFVGDAKNALKTKELEVAGTAKVYTSPLTVDKLSGDGSIVFSDVGTGEDKVGHSFVTVKKGFGTDKVELSYGGEASINEDTGAITAGTAGNFADGSKVLVCKIKDYDPNAATGGIKLADTEAATSGFANMKGAISVKPWAYTLSSTGADKYTLWTDVAAKMTSSTTDYTVTLTASADTEGALKMPKSGQYKSITIDGGDGTKVLSFTGSISADALNLKNIALKSYKLNKRENTKDGVAFAIKTKKDLTLSGVSVDGDSTIKSVTADNLTVSGTIAPVLTVKANALSTDANDTEATMSVQTIAVKNKVEGGAEKITLKFVDKSYEVLDDLSNVKIGVGAYGNQFKLDSTQGTGSELVLKGKTLVAQETSSEVYTLTTDAQDAPTLKFTTMKDAASYIQNVANSKDTATQKAGKASNYTIGVYESELSKLSLPKSGTFKSITLDTTATKTTIDADKIKKLPYNVTLAGEEGSEKFAVKGKLKQGKFLGNFETITDDTSGGGNGGGNDTPAADTSPAITVNGSKVTSLAMDVSEGAAFENFTSFQTLTLAVVNVEGTVDHYEYTSSSNTDVIAINSAKSKIKAAGENGTSNVLIKALDEESNELATLTLAITVSGNEE